MEIAQTTTKIPLHTDSEGTIRIGNTRVALESVLSAFKNGATCEEIVFQYPVLELGDVYAVIGFYLQNQEAMEQYLNAQKSDAARLQKQVQSKFPFDKIRKRLLKRRGPTPVTS